MNKYLIRFVSLEMNKENYHITLLFVRNWNFIKFNEKTY